ncbi:MAG: hypothetical protein P4L40_22695 [Terracidiphilus sp.]|nr:hypothetical protein [Terracidiphilus sp.]
MHAKLNLRLLVGLIGFALSAFAQVDAAKFAADLRARYGPPLARETFTGRPGVEMVVDYTANGHVCRIHLPPVGPSRDPNVRTPQAIDDFLSDLVPMNIRGKEQSRMLEATGLPSVSIIEYENVVIAEEFQGQRRTGVTVTFKKETCRDRPEY